MKKIMEIPEEKLGVVAQVLLDSTKEALKRKTDNIDIKIVHEFEMVDGSVKPFEFVYNLTIKSIKEVKRGDNDGL